jgi:glycosyltransferase involved in cell wall biosynthesis
MPDLKHYLAVVLLTVLPGVILVTDRGPVADETVYVRYAWSLHQHGVYGLARDIAEIPEPSAQVAPGVPFYIAAFMKFDRAFADSIRCLIASNMNPDSCDTSFRNFKLLNLVYLALFMIMGWHLLRHITSSATIAHGAVFLILLSGAPWYYADHYLTETLYLPMAMGFYLVFARALHHGHRRSYIFAAGILGLLALIRPSFFYLFLILVCLLPVILCYRRRKTPMTGKLILGNTLIFAGVCVLILSPWLVRNYQALDRPAVTVGYGAYALSSRVSYNQMTNMEYLAAWIYWLPDFGDSLAEDIFGEEHTRRLDFGSADGFIADIRSRIREQASQATGARLGGHETGAVISPVTWLLREYVLGDPLTHIKVTLVLAWRGIFVEKYFGLLGLMAMCWALMGGLRNEQRDYFFTMTLPVVILVFFHAFLTASIPRYNLSLLLPMCYCLSIAANRFGHCLMTMRKHRYGTKLT